MVVESTNDVYLYVATMTVGWFKQPGLKLGVKRREGHGYAGSANFATSHIVGATRNC